jgi:hypothetical protein
VLFSTGVSSAAYVPRGVEFLLSLNRLNVAISRARGLAFLVWSATLLNRSCRSPEQMRLANAFCRLVELASGLELRVRVGKATLTTAPPAARGAWRAEVSRTAEAAL